MTNKKTFKRFLTTASALGMIATGAHEAAAAPVAPVAGSVYLTGAAAANNVANISDHAAAPAAAVLAPGIPYSLYYSAAGQAFTANVDNIHFVTINTTVDNAGGNPGLFTVGAAGAASIRVGSIAGTGRQTFRVNGANGATQLILTGEVDPATVTYNIPAAAGHVAAVIAAPTYSGLGTVTMSNAQASTVIGGLHNGIQYNVVGQTFSGDFLAAANNDGNLTVSVGSSGNIFTGNIGDVAAGNALGSTTLHDNTIFQPGIGKTGINLGTTVVDLNKTITIDNTVSTGAPTSVAGTIDSAVFALGNHSAILQAIVGAQNLTFLSNIGTANAMHQINASLTGAGSLTFTGTTKAAAGGIVITSIAGGNTIFTGAVTTTTAGNFDATNAAGNVTLTAATTVDGMFKTGVGNVVGAGAGAVVVTGAVAQDSFIIGAGGYQAANAGSNVTITKGNAVFNNTGTIAAGGTQSVIGGTFTVTQGNLTTTTGDVTFNGNVIVGNAGNSGIMTTGAGIVTVTAATLTVAGNAAAANTNSLSIGTGGYVSTGGGSNVTVAVGNALFSADPAANVVSIGGNLNVITGSLTAGKGVVTIGGTLHTGQTLTTGNGKFTVGGATTIDNVVAAGAAVPVNAVVMGAGGGVFSGLLTVGAGNVNLSAATAITRADAGIVMSGAGSKIQIGTGGLVIGVADALFTKGGTIDLAGNTLTLIGATKVVAGAGYAADIVSSAAGSILSLGTDTLSVGGGVQTHTGSIKGNIGTAANAIGSIIVTGGATTTTIGGAGSTTTGVYAGSTVIKAAATLTVDATDHSILYTGTIDGGTPNVGTLTLTGANNNTITIAGPVGATSKLLALNTVGTTVFQNTVAATTITVKGTTTFNKAVAGNVDANLANSVTNFYSNVAGYITSANGNDVVNFGNGVAGTNITVAGDGANANGIGNFGQAIGTVNLKLGGGTLLVQTGSVNITRLNFQTDDTFTIDTNLAGTVAIGTIATTAGDNTGTINMNAQNVTFNATGDIGGLNARLKAVNFGNNTILNVTGGKNVYSAITGAGLTVNIAGASTLTSVGTATVPTTTFTTAGGGVASLDNLFATKTTNAGIINLSNNGTLKMGAYQAAGGTINLIDNALIGDIGVVGKRAAALTLTRNAGGTVILDGSTLAVDVITQNGNILKLTQDTITTGNTYTIGAASTIDTNGKALTMNTKLLVNAPLALKVTVSGNNAPVLTVSQAPAFANGAVLNLVLNTADSLPANGSTYNLFGTAGNVVTVATNTPVGGVGGGAARPTITAAQVALSNSGRFITTAYIDAASATAAVPAAAGVLAKPAAIEGTIKFTIATDANGIFGEKAGNLTADDKSNGNLVMNMINNGTATGDMAAIIASLNNMTDSEVGESFTRTFSHQEITASNQLAAQSTNATSQVLNGVNNHLNSITTVADAGGVAAGDASERFGIWAQAVGGTATQKQRQNAGGFETRGGGILVGFDTMVNDNATFGMLASTIRNNVKFKDANTGDKATSTSFIFGAYGNYDIGATDFFVQGNMTVAQTAVNSTGKKLVATGGVYQNAKAKYDILGVGAELVGGYKYKFDTSYIAPTIGLRYNYFGDTSYTGTGLKVGNQSIKTKANTIVSGLLGVKIGATVDMDGTNIMPEAHMNLSYAFNAPSSRTTFKINGSPSDFTYKGPKAARFGVNGGFSVMAEADGFEYGAGYDANISDKYLGHQGTLKVRVKL